MAEEFITEFTDGEFKVYNQDGRMILSQPYFPDGSRDPWTEQDAIKWWENNKERYLQPVREEPTDEGQG